MSKRVSRTFVAATGLRSLVPAGASEVSRAALLLGTALGCSIAIAGVAAPGVALAANECGPVSPSGTTDTATCAANTDYPGGIIYADGSTNTLLVQLQSGVTVEDPTGPGVFAINYGGGQVEVDTAAGGAITVYGDGIDAYATGQNVTINNNDSISSGARGLYGYGIGGGDVTINNTGSIYSNGANGQAVGIFAYAVLGGNAEVVSSGPITINADSSNASGIYAVAPGASATVNNTGDITVTNTGYASGAEAYNALVAKVVQTGNVSVTSTGGSATGVFSAGTLVGVSYVYGDVAVTAYSAAHGVMAYADQTVGLADSKVYGDVSVTGTGTFSTALGVQSNGAIADIDVQGNITATSAGYALGANAVAYNGDATTVVSGSVNVTSTAGKALGLNSYSTNGNSTVIADSDITVSGATDAGGVWSGAPGQNTVVIGGNVHVSAANGYAYGVSIYNGAGNVTIEGNLTVYANNGDAKGVYGSYNNGNNTVTIIGSANVTSHTGYAVGVYESAYASPVETVSIGGSLNVSGETGATGVFVDGGASSVSIVGDVSVTTDNGDAYGVSVIAAAGNYDSSVSIGGNVSVSSTTGYATGVSTVANYANVTTHVGGDVTVTAANGSATGIFSGQESDTPYSNTVSVGGNVSVTGLNDATGIQANGGNLDISVTGGVSATSTNGIANAIETLAYGGNISVDGNVSASSTNGFGAAGVLAFNEGDTSVSIGGNVNVSAPTGIALGTSVWSLYGGNVTIDVAGSTTVSGYVGAGVWAVSLGNGTVNVNVGDVTFNQYAPSSAFLHGAGVDVLTGGSAYVTAGNVVTTGDVTDGVRVGYFFFGGLVEGDSTVNVASVNTSGNYSDGIQVEGLGNSTITVGSVYTSGYRANGVDAYSEYGGVTVTAGNAVTKGDNSTAIFAEAGGPVVINVGYSSTSGDNSDAVVGINNNNTPTDTVSITAGTTYTHGDDSVGIFASGYYATSVTSGLVKTFGYESDGIVALSDHGPVSVTSGTVITHGDYSDGVYAKSGNGTVSVTSDYVHTYGYHSTGIYALGLKDVTVTSGGVKTEGYYADGIQARSSGGNVSVTSNYVSTLGNGAAGIYAYTSGGNATVNSGTVETYSFLSPGIVAIANNGTASVTSNYVRTQGYESIGIEAYGYFGATVHNTGLVETDYSKSIGIDAYAVYGPVTVTSNAVRTYGDNSVGIRAYSQVGDIYVGSTDVRTYGGNSRAISAVALLGNVTINSGLAVTHGASSDAIVGVTDYGGDIAVYSDQVFTYGAGSQGIHLHAHEYGNVSVVSNFVITRGAQAEGIYAVANQGTAYVYSGVVGTYGNFSTAIDAEGAYGATVISHGAYAYGFSANGIYARSINNGDVNVTTYGTTYAYDGVGVFMNSAGYATLNNKGAIYGGEVGVVSISNYGTTINNAVGASISGFDGFAILTEGGSTTINNAGVIYGYAALYSSDNTVNNSGFWKAYGNSYFGAGDNNVFNNTGVVTVAPFSPAATTVVWNGLSVFNNSGLIDLRNQDTGGSLSHTGDIFILNSNTGGTAFNGLAGSKLAVDVDLGPSMSSDKLVVGAVSGQTTVLVNDVDPGAPAVLNFTGTTVAQGTSGTASNFVMAPVEKGFIDYQLTFNASNTTWNIVGLPGQGAFEMLKAPEMAQGYWRRSGDAWSAREQEIRDSISGSTPPTRGEGWEMWAQAQIGGERLSRSETFNLGGVSFSPTLGTDTDWRGFQMGADERTSRDFIWGFTGGFLEQNTSFHLDKNSFDMTGWNLGVYGGFTHGAFFANGLIKADWFDLKANMHTVPALETNSGNTWGAKGEMGFRLGGAHLYFEPLVDLAWTTTHLDDANFNTQLTTFTFGNADSLRGSVGARVGGQWGSLLPYVGLYAVDEFEGQNKVTMLTGSGCPDCMTLEDTRPGTYGKADFGFTTTSWNGLEGFLKGETEFGSHVDGFTGRLGVRWRW
jgi:uncharacterized protein YhjY with autotransporter beta-barrel domain